jgi:hypothetical protein
MGNCMASADALHGCGRIAVWRGRELVMKFAHFCVFCPRAPSPCHMAMVDTAVHTAAARQACAQALLRSLLDGKEHKGVRRMPPPPAPPTVRRFAARVAANHRHADAAKARLLQELAKPPLPIPDVEGALAAGCHLCRSQTGHNFRRIQLQRHFAAVFAAVAAHAPALGLPVELSRFCTFHGHLFVTTSCVGLLIHSREYPALGPDFDINLGNCQVGSMCHWNSHLMALRNILYIVPARLHLDTRLVVLHTGELPELLAPGVSALHTVYESDFGQPLADVNYMHKAPRVAPEHRLYVCT